MTDSPKASKAKSPNKTGPSQLLSIFALSIAIISLIIAAVFGGLFWHNRTLEQTNLNNTQQQANQANLINKANITVLQQQSQLQQRQLLNLENKLSQIMQHTHNINRQRDLSEAGYLIHLANLQLTVNQDPKTALKLLTLAKNTLRQINDSSVFNIKHSVTNDIAKLTSLPKVDITRIVLQLNRLNQQIQSMPFIEPTTFTPVKTITKKDEKTSDNHWYDAILTKLSGLKELVIIRHVRKPIMPLVSPKQERFIKANLQTKLMQAQWAVMHRNNTLYQNALQQVVDWLNSYWPNKKTITPVIKRVTALQKNNISPPLPNLQNSLNAIDAELAATTSPSSPSKPDNKTTHNPGTKTEAKQ